jgi:hypothetical protein
MVPLLPMEGSTRLAREPLESGVFTEPTHFFFSEAVEEP